MTISELLEMDIQTLSSMTDDELKEHLKPYLNITRPELADKTLNRKTNTKVSKRTTSRKNQDLLAGAKALLAGDVDKARFLAKGQIK